MEDGTPTMARPLVVAFPGWDALRAMNGETIKHWLLSQQYASGGTVAMVGPGVQTHRGPDFTQLATAAAPQAARSAEGLAPEVGGMSYEELNQSLISAAPSPGHGSPPPAQRAEDVALPSPLGEAAILQTYTARAKHL